MDREGKVKGNQSRKGIQGYKRQWTLDSSIELLPRVQWCSERGVTGSQEMRVHFVVFASFAGVEGRIGGQMLPPWRTASYQHKIVNIYSQLS